MDLDDSKHGIETIEDEEADESFPASDPPSWSGMHIGAPCPAWDAETATSTTEAPRTPRDPREDCDPDGLDDR